MIKGDLISPRPMLQMPKTHKHQAEKPIRFRMVVLWIDSRDKNNHLR